ncbi:unnamed protein product [Owenia fusiformis]|uniref:Uncharacterized protein n=1 Tax=Owenia fusiformis TaxID=6347 RepID=A0A8S4N1H8_OWEFU|nr:unnamed protein product [Owenia fusiformis]
MSECCMEGFAGQFEKALWKKEVVREGNALLHMDNALAHRSQNVQKTITLDLKIEPLANAPYCPDLLTRDLFISILLISIEKGRSKLYKNSWYMKQ